MPHPSPEHLSRRERQIMDILYERGEASAAEVLEALPDPPSYSAVRAALRILEEKGHVSHERRGQRYVFSPVVSRRQAQKKATQRLVKTFFDGSREKAVAALLGDARQLDAEELDRIADLIEDARKEGR
ncbi:MAG: BlaI/MecI/CopY family transcriptional regulator [Acidobacteriota bacterium]|jgi:predicted transcriptional regulator